MLEDASKGILDPLLFPYTKPPLDSEADAMATQASLRSSNTTCAQNRKSTHESKQRVMVFMAGGATFSESRACYEISKTYNKDVFLATSHLLTPALFVRQVSDLSTDRRRLDLPVDRPKPKAPSHLFEREEAKLTTSNPSTSATRSQPIGPRPTSASLGSKRPAPPTAAMGAMSLNGASIPQMTNGSSGQPTQLQDASRKGKLEKKSKEGEEKKKRNFFSSKK